MCLETLSEDLKCRLRGGVTITTINQCVIELILNALDAKATAIATQLNFRTFRIQVVDNGDGISKSNLNLIASHYTTNRCHSLKDYQRSVKYHGYRGESLACMSEICTKLSITSRETNSNETFLKIFEGKVSNTANKVKFRPSEGTTVTLENVFYNLPVRRKRINPELDFDALKQFLVALSVIYPNVSLTLRNDATTKMLFKNQKCNTVVDSLISYCPELQKDSLSNVRFSKHKVRMSGLLSKKLYPNGKLQLIYINKRPVNCLKLQKLISNCLKTCRISTGKKQDVYPVYALNIKCPYADVNLSFENNNYVSSIEQFDVIENFIINSLATVKSKEKPTVVNISPSLKTVDSDNETSYAQLSEICNLSGFVQSKIPKQKDAVHLESTESKIKSNQNQFKEFDFKTRQTRVNLKVNEGEDTDNQSEIYELEMRELHDDVTESANNDLHSFKKVQSPKNLQLKSVTIPKVDAQICRKDCLLFDTDILLPSSSAKVEQNYFRKYFDKAVANKMASKFGNKEKQFGTQAKIVSSTSVKTLNNDDFNEDHNNIPEPILSEDPREQNGKLQIMKKFLKSTQLHSSNIKNSTEDATKSKPNYTNTKQMEKNSSGVILNSKSLTRHRSSSVNKTIDTSRLLTQPNEEELKGLLNEQKKVRTSIFNREHKTSKLIQTSFVDNTCNNIGNNDKEYVYHINFNQLNLHGKGKLNVNLQVNKNNVDIKFDLNQSKYFPTSVRNEGATCENEKKQETESQFVATTVFASKEAFNIVNEHTEVRYMNQSKYFTTSKDATNKKIVNIKKSCNKNETINDNTLEERSSYDVRNTSSNDIISATSCEEIHAAPRNESIFHNMSNLNQIPYEMQFKNTIPEDFHIWTDRSKIDLDFNSVSQQDIFKPSCSKVCHDQGKEVAHSNAVSKNILKRHSTEPVCLSRKSLDDPKKRFLSQDASSSDKSYKEFVEQLEDINQTKGKVIESLRFSKNDTIISSNLISEFVNTSIIGNQKDILAINTKQSDIDKVWYTQNNGEFYVNKKTGFTTFKNPKTAQFDFNLKHRNEDIPKGVSPIVTRVDKCLFSLSPSKRDQLHNAILKSYEEELDIVKWGHFIKENDPKTFFNALFKSRTKYNPIQIPDISNNTVPKAVEKLFNCGQSKSFVDDLFSHLEVIGQLDQKFILAFYKYNQLIFVFDQHAVHERIRLEQLQQTYINEDKSFDSIASNVIYKINFTLTEIDCLLEHQRKINNLGLYFTVSDNDYILVEQIPICLHNKFEKLIKNEERNAFIILKSLFEEILANLKSTRGSLQIVPKVMQNIINLEACRGAIKFGEALTMETCQKLLNNLGKCNLPFQCAHGRPTLIPLVELTDNYHTLLKT